MPDIYTTITEADPTIVDRLAGILELRAADPSQQAMLASYLADIDFPAHPRLLEVGCGTGAIARQIAPRIEGIQLVGLDPSPVFIDKARTLSASYRDLSFQVGDAHQLPFPEDSFDVVLFHTVLCHLSDPQQAVVQACRVLRPGGWLAIFEGDYASMTFGTSPLDPLEICAEATRTFFVHDSWLARRTPALAVESGYQVQCYRTFGYSETASPNYMLTIVDRGAEALVTTGQIGTPMADAMKAEARRRVQAGHFFGSIPYTSLIARKPQEQL